MKVQKTINLESDDLNWFNQAYDGASLSWVLGLLLSNFRAIHNDTGVQPNKVARDSAKETKIEVDDADS